MKNNNNLIFNIKIKDSDGVTRYSCKNTITNGCIILPYTRKGRTSCQILLTSEFSWSKCNHSYIGKPKIYNNGRYVVVTPCLSNSNSESEVSQADVKFNVYLEDHEDNETPDTLMGSFKTKKQAQEYIETLHEIEKSHAYIQQEVR